MLVIMIKCASPTHFQFVTLDMYPKGFFYNSNAEKQMQWSLVRLMQE